MRLAPVCVLALAILSSPACYRTKTVSVADAPADTRAWLTLSDQSVVLVYGPQIYGKRLVGYVGGKYEEFLLADVQAVHVRHVDGARTAALVAAGALGFAGFAYALTGAAKSSPPDYCDAPEHVDEPICQGP